MSLHFIMFSSEHVSEGHPDKLCDQVSDAILDACLKFDKMAKVACETCAKTGMILVFGEITTTAVIDYQKVVRSAIEDIGFDDGAKGMDYKSLNLLVAIEQQSPDIFQGLGDFGGENLGAGDQGMMFGYATDETETFMPMSYELARQLAMKYSELRKNGSLEWARPDAKTQVTIQYESDTCDNCQMVTPKRIECVLISAQHDDGVTNEKIREDLMEKVIKPVLPEKMLDAQTKYWLNPSGRFVIGGPMATVAGTRGGLPYAIGVAEPLSIHVDSYGTGTVEDDKLLAIVNKNFKLRPHDIITELDLRRPIYYMTAKFGHFGRTDTTGANGFTWENPKKLIIE
uniref:S-adenosylmethionine synthase n=1 Tax=Cryptobia salmositica TaxID=86678 RepID=Q6J2L0_9EUGL|nr:MetK [Cryptobia salmositica]